MLSKIHKAIAALVAGVGGWATFVIESEPSNVTSSEWLLLYFAVATALGVYAVPNAE